MKVKMNKIMILLNKVYYNTNIFKLKEILRINQIKTLY
jgi:hypothetical protein